MKLIHSCSKLLNCGGEKEAVGKVRKVCELEIWNLEIGNSVIGNWQRFSND